MGDTPKVSNGTRTARSMFFFSLFCRWRLSAFLLRLGLSDGARAQTQNAQNTGHHVPIWWTTSWGVEACVMGFWWSSRQSKLAAPRWNSGRVPIVESPSAVGSSSSVMARVGELPCPPQSPPPEPTEPTEPTKLLTRFDIPVESKRAQWRSCTASRPAVCLESFSIVSLDLMS